MENLRRMSDKHNLSWIVLAGLAIVLLIATLNCDASLLFYSVMVLWGCLLIYAIQDVRNRAGLFVFLLAFFLFLLGGDFFEMYLGYPQEFEFSVELDNHAYLCLLISLAFLFVGFSGTSRGQARLKPLPESKKWDPEQMEILRRVLKIGLYVTVVPYFLKTLDAGLYTMQNGYLKYYTEFKCRLPVPVEMVSELFTLFFFAYLATLPPKKDCLIPMSLYFVHGVLAMITGRRISVGIAALVIAAYVLYRHGRNRDEKWLNRKKILIVIALCPLAILALYAHRYLRYGQSVESGGILEMMFRFLSQQGTSINILKFQKQFEGDPLGCTSLYYSLHYLRSNVLTRELVDFPTAFYSMRNVKSALRTNNLADYIMYMVNRQDYYAGYGLGTSFIAELHHDLGYIGVALGSALYGAILSWQYRSDRYSLWKFTAALMMLEEFVIMPRYGADVILRPFYNLTKMLVFLTLIIYAEQVIKRGRQLPSFLMKILRKLRLAP